MAPVTYNGKLERGSYYYITVGGLFFKGLAPEITEKEVVEPRPDYWTMKRSFISVRKRRDRWRTSLKRTIVRTQTGKTLYLWTENPEEAKQFRRKDKAAAMCVALRSEIVDPAVIPVIHLHERKAA